MTAESNRVIYRSIVDETGDYYATATLTPTEDKREKIVLAKPYVIPVLFLPGIMGTNLRKTDGKDVAWRPPNTDLQGAGDAIVKLVSYLFKSAKERAQDLALGTVEVDPRGPIDEGDSGLPKNVLVCRGWGSVMRSSYHPFMARLQHLLNNLAEYDFDRCEADLKHWAAEFGHESPTEWGATHGEALTREEILYACNYQFDIWAGGYNWLQSNRDSGAAIQELIEKTILPHYNDGKAVVVSDTPDGKGNDICRIKRIKPHRPLAEKVIVVTHSMGGLVSRALTEIHQCDKVLGVSHGVMPATGAPATYKRMRAGFEGIEQVILGGNAAEVVAVLAQAPGGLELLPTADYNDGKPWLKVRDKKGGKEFLALPVNGDPYGEIYKSPAWYGLVPDGNLPLVKPKRGKSKQVDSTKTNNEKLRCTLDEAIEEIKRFHEAIGGRYNNPTYIHYGAQGARQSEKDPAGLISDSHRFSWGDVVWEGRNITTEDLSIAHDDGNGTLRTKDGLKLEIAAPDSPGDGTVPVHSGKAPLKSNIALGFAHGHGNPGSHNDHFGYDHQASYADKHQRSLYSTIFAIIKIAQQAKWHKNRG
ncbi:hypothetical protein [Cupriavidus campinensis]